MMQRASFLIAGLGLEVLLAEELQGLLMQPNFAPFRRPRIEKPILKVEVLEPAAALEYKAGELLDEDHNDMGHVRLYASGDDFRVVLRQAAGGSDHTMWLSASLDKALIAFDPSDRYAREALSSLLRIAFSQAALNHRAVSLHASCVVSEGEAILFLGKSGTGKSTHARLWMAEGAELLNDDNPLLRIEEEGVKAYGTPWSGKTPCYKDAGYPLRGIVRLSQAAENRFTPLQEFEAFVALLPSASVIRRSEELHNKLCDLLGEVTLNPGVLVGALACRPDREAWLCCREGLRKSDMQG